TGLSDVRMIRLRQGCWMKHPGAHGHDRPAEATPSAAEAPQPHDHYTEHDAPLAVHTGDDPTHAKRAGNAPHAAHTGHGGHGAHAGHSPEMFRDRFWLSLALTVPILYFSEQIQEWLGYRAITFPGSEWVNPVLGTVLFLYGGLVFLQGARH